MSHVAGGRLNIVFTGNESCVRWEFEYSLYLLVMSRVTGGRLNIPCIYW